MESEILSISCSITQKPAELRCVSHYIGVYLMDQMQALQTIHVDVFNVHIKYLFLNIYAYLFCT